MPGMPIFQSSPSQLKGQIYVVDSTNSNVVPLKVDNSGNLPVNFSADSTIDAINSVTTLDTITNDVKIVNGASALTVGLATDSALDSVDTLGTITNDVKIVNGASALTVGLATDSVLDSVDTLGTITNDVKIVNGASALTVGLATDSALDSVDTLGTITNDVKIVNGASALTVGLAAGENIIGKVQNDLVFTNADSFGSSTLLTPKEIAIGATVESDAQDISKESSYNWYIKNTGTTGSDEDVTLIVQVSPDGTNWVEDTGDSIALIHDTAQIIPVTNFLKYARFVITGGTASTTVISCYQAQH